MARTTKRQVLTTVSVLWLLALTVLAIWALYLNNFYSLPINTLLAALTVALPPLAGIALEASATWQYRDASDAPLRSPRLFFALNTAFLVYETVLATLIATHLTPADRRHCLGRDQWQRMSMTKDTARVKRIQDALQCCGFSSPKDMAYPFPDKTHGADACMVRYDRDAACGGVWMDMEKKVAIMLIIVPVGVFMWKLAIYLMHEFCTPWLPSAIRLPSDRRPEHDNIGANRAAITFESVNDDVQEEVRRLNDDSSLATHIEGSRHPPE